MPEPLDPAVAALLESAPRAPLALPNPAQSLAERARAFRARDAERPPPLAFDGTIEERPVPVRWGSVPGRVYRPHGIGERPPVVAFFHGGGFIAGDLDSHDGLCRELAIAARAVLVAVAYRLAPETPFPGGLEDAYDATTWLAAAAPELGVELDGTLAWPGTRPGRTWRPAWRCSHERIGRCRSPFSCCCTPSSTS